MRVLLSYFMFTMCLSCMIIPGSQEYHSFTAYYLNLNDIEVELYLLQVELQQLINDLFN